VNGFERLSSEKPILAQRADIEASTRLARKIIRLCAKARDIDAISAAFGVAVHIVVNLSPDLPTALENVDRLATDMKDKLRERLGN
jgi:hypothetical protein